MIEPVQGMHCRVFIRYHGNLRVQRGEKLVLPIVSKVRLLRVPHREREGISDDRKLFY